MVRRELDLHPGELFDGDEMDLATDRLRTTGFFSDEQNRPNAWVEQEKIPDDPKRENIVLRVNDGTNGVFNIFGGIASGQGPFFGVDLAISNADIFDLPSSPGSTFQEFIEQRAFHGAGQRIHLRANPGSTTSNYLVEFSEPYLSGPDVNPYFLSVNAHLQEYLPRFYDERTVGTTLTVGKKLTRNTAVSLGARIDNVDISNIVTLTPPIEDLEAAEGVTQVHGLIADWNWQRLDSLQPDRRQGASTPARSCSAGRSAARSTPGKLSASVENLFPVVENEDGQRQVWSVRGAVGFATVRPRERHPLLRALLRGRTNDYLQLRGFEYRGVGPHDQGFSEGGEIGWVVNTEYVFPLLDTYDARLRENQPFLRGLLFMDQGMLSSDWNVDGRPLALERRRGHRLASRSRSLSAPLGLYYGVRCSGAARTSARASRSAFPRDSEPPRLPRCGAPLRPEERMHRKPRFDARRLLVPALLLFAYVSVGFRPSDAPKIAFIDMSKLVSQHKQSQAEQTLIQQWHDAMRKLLEADDKNSPRARRRDLQAGSDGGSGSSKIKLRSSS